MVMHMMLSHMCEEPYWLLRKTFLIQLAVSLLLVIGVVPWVCLMVSLKWKATRDCSLILIPVGCVLVIGS